jgi:hypothetical protein
MKTIKRRQFFTLALTTATGFLALPSFFNIRGVNNSSHKTVVVADEDYILINNWYLKKEDLNYDQA